MIKIWACLLLWSMYMQEGASFKSKGIQISPFNLRRFFRGPLGRYPLYNNKKNVDYLTSKTPSSSSSLTLAQSENRSFEDDNRGDFLSLSKGGTAQLKTLMEKMPLEEKYSLLLQSYASSVIERSAKDSTSILKTMESLYTEMLCLSIKPGETSARSLLNAAATFCNSEILAEVLQLIKAGGYMRGFGVINSQLTKPIISASAEGKGLLANTIQVPEDDRDAEVLYSSIVAATATAYISLQVLGHTISTDLAPWATLFGFVAVLSGIADVVLRKGKGLKLAAAGVDRLVLSDAEREFHSESAAFLSAYMLGLPCFCFQPEVSEALKMLRDAPGSLSAYLQPQARFRSAPRQTNPNPNQNQKSGNFFGINMTGGKKNKNKKSSNSDGRLMNTLMKSTSPVLRSEQADETYEVSRKSVKESLVDIDSIEKADIVELGRVLVWIMSPVAAEMQRYGKTVVSDPKRGRRLLDVLEALQTAERKDISKVVTEDEQMAQNIVTSLPHIDIPTKEEDKNALLCWAYFEADALLKQYADLVVDIGDYLSSGSSSVGEVVALLEQELI